jgi:hypothetical protein
VVSPVTLNPQDKEGFGSVISHEENVKFIFEESRTLHSNQLVNEDSLSCYNKDLKDLLEKLSIQTLLLLEDVISITGCSFSAGKLINKDNKQNKPNQEVNIENGSKWYKSL